MDFRSTWTPRFHSISWAVGRKKLRSDLGNKCLFNQQPRQVTWNSVRSVHLSAYHALAQFSFFLYCISYNDLNTRNCLFVRSPPESFCSPMTTTF